MAVVTVGMTVAAEGGKAAKRRPVHYMTPSCSPGLALGATERPQLQAFDFKVAQTAGTSHSTIRHLCAARNRGTASLRPLRICAPRHRRSACCAVSPAGTHAAPTACQAVLFFSSQPSLLNE